MTKLWKLISAAILACVPLCALAQYPPGGPADIAGTYYASNFAGWTVPQGNNGPFAWSSAAVCQQASSGGVGFQPFVVGSPIRIVDTASPSQSENVTVTAVRVNGSGCAITTTTPAHQHLSFYLTSATGGLQEAINFSRQNYGVSPSLGVVITTADWERLGGTTGIIVGAAGGSNVSVLDLRTSCPVSYTWSGSSYVGIDLCDGGGGGQTIVEVNGTPTSPVSPVNFVDSGTVTWSLTGATVSATANSGLVLQHNGTNLTDQLLLNFNDSTPAPPTGYQNVAFQTDSSGKLSAYYLPGGGLETQVIPPIDGQYVVVYPTVGTITADPSGGSVIGPQGGVLRWTCAGVFCTIADHMRATWSGFVLPSYVNPANVTAVYADAVSSGVGLPTMPQGGTNTTQLWCSTMTSTGTLFPLYGIDYPWSTYEGTSATTITGAGVATASCVIDLGSTNVFPGVSGVKVNLPALRLLVYYTGDPPPARTAIDVVPPLAYNPAALTLSDDANGRFIDGGSDSVVLTVTSSNTASTALVIDNTSVSGGGYQLFEGGSANGNPGSFGVYNTGTTHQPLTIKANDDVILSSLSASTSPICANGTGGALTTVGCAGGGGSVSGQANGVIPLATASTTIGAQSHLDDGISTAGTITSSEPIAVGGSTHGVSIPAGTAVAGAAGEVVYASDATNGYAEVNENNTGLSRVCTQGNAVCSGSSFITSLTTTGSSGAATVSSGVLNVPVYAGGGGTSNPYTCTVQSTNLKCLGIAPYSATTGGDNSALLQQAITDLSSVGGGDIYVPCGVYPLTGALQDPTGANAIVQMPKIISYSGTPIGIHIHGCAVPAQSGLTTGVTVFSTTETTGNIFGGYEATSGGFGPLTNVYLSFENIVIRQPPNPQMVAINATNIVGLRLDHVWCDVSGTPVTPTNTTGACVLAPTIANSAFVQLYDVTAVNTYTGFVLGEHTTFDGLYGSVLHDGFIFESAATLVGNANSVHGGYAWCQLCVNQVVSGGLNPIALNISNMDLESTSGNGILDTGNLLYGTLNYHVPAASGAVTPANPNVSGAANLHYHNLDFPGIAVSADAATNGGGGTNATWNWYAGTSTPHISWSNPTPGNLTWTSSVSSGAGLFVNNSSTNASAYSYLGECNAMTHCTLTANIPATSGLPAIYPKDGLYQGSNSVMAGGSTYNTEGAYPLKLATNNTVRFALDGAGAGAFTLATHTSLTENGEVVCTASNSACGAGSGTVTSVAQTVPSWLAVGGSPVTTTGTLAITAATGQTSHQVLGTCGAATSFGPCALTFADLPTTLPWSCQPGLGDGLNAITAGTYLTTTCRNETGVTLTLTAIRCVANAGSSTCNATNGAGTGLLTGAITGTSTYANGTQSGTTTIASGDYIKVTYVADGTSKQIGIDLVGTY